MAEAANGIRQEVVATMTERIAGGEMFSLPAILSAIESGAEGSEAIIGSAGANWVFAITSADDDAARKPRRFIFIIDNFNTA